VAERASSWTTETPVLHRHLWIIRGEQSGLLVAAYTLHNDAKQSSTKRSINGGIGLRVPAHAIREKCAPYLRPL
jgi:hypothetical protein